MYETELSSQKVYYTKSKGYGDPIELYGYTKDGETPMSLLNMSLASCVSMCVQSYYFKKFKKDSIDLKTYAKYDDRKFLIDISLSETLDKKREDDLRAFVFDYCRVSKLLAKDVEIVINFNS